MLSLPSRAAARLFLGAALCAAPAQADIIYADANLTTGAGDGSSWADAFQGPLGFQDAIAAAVAGDQIFVAEGTYLPGNVGQRALSFRPTNGIEMFGGFAGGESSPVERPPFGDAPTILSADLAGDDNSGGSNAENSFHVIRANGTDATAVMDGFVARGGNSNGNGNNDRGGGVLCINGAGATFRNCSFEDNRCTFGGGAGYINGSSPSFFNCRFEGNSGGNFGGAFDIATAGNVTFDGCFFRDNNANRAGAFEVFATSGVVVSNSVFVENRAGGGGGGGLWFGGGGSSTLVNCTVVANECPSQANAGIRVQGATPVIRNTIVYDNIGPGGSQSSSAQVNSGANLQHCIVEGGYAGATNSGADPLFVGGGDVSLSAGSPAIDAGNNSAFPAGILIDFAGNPRFVDDPTVADTGVGSAPLIDIGAYEIQVDAGGPMAFCFGDGSGTACPCTNGSTGEGCANATGSGTVLTATGSLSAAADDLVFTNSGMPMFQPALLFVGTSQVNGGSGAVFGNGLRCVGGQVVRLGVVSAGAGTTTTWGPGLGALGGWSAGDTRYFQAWYRDPANPCGGSFNFSNALEATFLP